MARGIIEEFSTQTSYPYLEFTRIGHRRLELDRVDQGLSQSNVLDGRIIKPIHIIPDCNRNIPNIASERSKLQDQQRMNTHN